MVDSAPEIIKELVERFDENKHIYKSSSYDEENTKIEFINPFFEALGWDVHNKEGASARFKEVVFEDTIHIGGKAKAPDYSFRYGGQRVFFVEAKKPSVNIETDKNPAFQVRRYGWSAKLPLCILTDFEELAIYETNTKPDKNQSASIGRIKYYKYTDYVEKWDEIASIFSKESVKTGAFDNFASGQKGTKKGTTEVDDEFLKEINNWRLLLAKNIALRNKELSIEELNHAVQLTIDRIIFLRIAEDRGIEKYEQLKNLLELSEGNKGNNVYEGFIKLCKKADAKYNSGLFHFKEEKGIDLDADNLTPNLLIDDGVFKQIFKNLYYPNCPYEFSVISTEILGNVYEQFLGEKIRLTNSHQAKVEEKPEVKKAGGVFYTPQYIVDYIVKNTIGELLKGKTPNQVSKMKFVDPACGSGSFLLGAFQYLINWHIDYYSNMERPPKDVIYTAKDGITRLTVTEKKRIVVNNIYGVDIDAQAVEVSKLSLLLKVLEDSNKDELEAQQKLFQERALPYLGDNIRCGNSLIGSDILEKDDLTLEEIKVINPFDWNDEFAEVFENGGFDAVIGNPPYVRQERIKEIKPYLKDHYETYTGVADLYVYFFEKGINILKENGYFGVICSNKYAKAKYGKKLRKFILNNKIIYYTDFTGDNVFKTASVDASVIIVSNKNSKDNTILIDNLFELKQSLLSEESWIFQSPEVIALKDKINSKGILIKDCENIFINRGILTGFNKAFIIDDKLKNQLILSDEKNEEIIKPFLSGKDINKGFINFKNTYLILSKSGMDIKKEYSVIYNHLEQYKNNLKKRTDKGKFWFNLRACSFYEEFEKPKLIYPEIGLNLTPIYDDNKFYLNKTCFMLTTKNIDSAYIGALLSSKVLNFIFRLLGSPLGSSGYVFSKIYIEKLPIILGSELETDLSSLFIKINNLKQELINCKTPNEKRLIEKQIEVTDNKINRLVYELYDLTEEEIEIIEDSLKN